MKRLLEIDRSANVVALSAAIGTFIGFSPYFGFHTVMGIAVSYIFNLPIYPVILGAYITNPITVLFIYAFCYKVGLILTDIKVNISIDWKHLTFQDMFNNVKEVFIPFFVGTHVVGIIAAFIVYIIIFYIVKKYKNR
ncbi:DUF2062 domain-containing protein [Deferribacter abyssi]|uniref:DUF2062 domain-containing protein n=1 Tax=Deferribacter abyssi TaxID=213806 RepID=UPI003C23A2EC